MKSPRHTGYRFSVPCAVMVLLSLFQVCAHAQQGASRFSSVTLRNGVERFLQEKLDENDMFEIGGGIDDQVFTMSNVTARCEAGDESLRGNTKVAIVFTSESRMIRRIYVPVRITLMRLVPVTLRNINRGEVIGSNDVEMSLRDVTYNSGFGDESVVGKRTLFDVRKGVVISGNSVIGTDVIQRGDAVTVVLSSGIISVRTTGVALNDAAPGQAVRVRRDDSSIILSGSAGANKTVLITMANSD